MRIACHRRSFVSKLVASGILVLGLAGLASAQDYPARPIQLIIPFAAGGGFDQTSRNFAQALGEVLRQPLAAINVDGATGAIGLTRLAAAAPDGYTLGMSPAVSMTSEPHRNRNLTYGLESFRPVCQVFDNIFALAVPRDSTYRNLADLIADARRNPGKVSYGTAGIGSIPHLAIADLEVAAGIELLHVPYRGDGPMQVDLLQGRVGFGGVLPSSFIAQVRAGNLRLLAVLPEQRHPSFPEIPTLTESGFPVVQLSFGGLLAPARTPAAIIAMLEAACEKAVHSPAMRTWAAGANQVLNYANGQGFSARLARDSAAKAATLKRLKLAE
ncbi:MAG: tripartite tricarboxylate transporter substrate binding protein [Burkholderiales bacterium]|nr:tripartite tricarboxylate transporter substrate binding protein [Burkholderiales bacterium]